MVAWLAFPMLHSAETPSISQSESQPELIAFMHGRIVMSAKAWKFAQKPPQAFGACLRLS